MTSALPEPPVVVCCGLATLDLVQTVERLPGPDEKVVARDLHVAAGGPATNAAVTAAALGVRARLVTRIGSGPLADAVRADLAAHDVQVWDTAADGYAPAVSTVLVTAATGERAVVSVNAAGSAPAPPGKPTGAARAADAVVGASVLLVDGHHLDLAIPLAREARRVGVPVLLDGGSWKPGLEALLQHVDVAVVSADLQVPAAAQVDGGDVLTALAALGPGVVARSRGRQPIELLTTLPTQARGTADVPEVPVVDTLGAGDVLHGALAAWWAHHPATTTASGPVAWRGALEVAASVASSSCADVGARGWLRVASRVAAARVLVGARR